MWAIDFIRACVDRPIWARILIRLVMGKLAFREFIGLLETLDANGFSPHEGYNLEDMDYHADKVPFDWWRERGD